MMTRHRALRMLPRSTAIFAIASLWVCTLGGSLAATAAHPADPSMVGLWEGPGGAEIGGRRDPGPTTVILDVAADGFVSSGKLARGGCLMLGSIESVTVVGFFRESLGTAQLRCTSDRGYQHLNRGIYHMNILSTSTSPLFSFALHGRDLRFGTEVLKRVRFGRPPAVDPARVGPAVVGHWSSAHGVMLDITAAAQLSGTAGDCTFRSSRAAVVSRGFGAVLLLGYVDAICTGNSKRSFLAWIDARPPVLKLELSDARETFTVRDMSRSNGLGSGGSAVSIDPGIAGNWSGAADGTQLTLDLAADGSFSGAISGGVLGGCAFEGSTDPGSALVNNETSFLDFGVATLSGCDVSTNDGDDYFVLLGATPKSLGISFFADEQAVGEDAPVLKIDGLSRSVGGL
jgi:hypothetical protein